MQQQVYGSKRSQAMRRATLKRNRNFVFSIIMAALIIVAVLMGFKLFKSAEKPLIKIAQPLLTPMSTQAIADSLTFVSDKMNLHVGIVSGHKGYDPGTVCDDGLTEAEVNYNIAREVINLLERQGIQADLLNEFDDRIKGYQADALVSIHADSCAIPGRSGFKVARVTHSAIPKAEDKLVACLNQEYAVYTALPQHPSTITDNMTNYHAFNDIAPLTPGAIIETGFLLDDRALLEHKPKLVAKGIAAGIFCFLKDKSSLK